MNEKLTSLQRVLTTLGHKEPDRVPLFLFPTLHGAKELSLSLKEYFSKAENVAEGQLRLLKKYGHDCVTPFFYAPLEIEAMGGEIRYVEDGPVNSTEPFIKDVEQIRTLQLPRVSESPRLREVLKATGLLKEKVGGKVPVVGVMISPFSLPVMQIGFDAYLDLIFGNTELFQLLINKNMEFSAEWANAQLDAGADVIGYFDPISSTTILPVDVFREKGYHIAKAELSKIKGPLAILFASGRCMEIIEDVIDLGFIVAGVSTSEDLTQFKEKCKGKITLLGNLDAIKMRKWTAEQAEEEVKCAIAKAGQGGGFILSDNHGEIPWMVPDETLMAISNAVRRWGVYPLDWVEEYNARKKTFGLQ